MESMDNVRERIEALEQQTEPLTPQPSTRARQARWWRGITCGLVVLGWLSWAQPLGPVQDLLQQPSQTLRALEPSRHVTRQVPYGRLPMSFEANQSQVMYQFSWSTSLYCVNFKGFTKLIN